MIYSHKTKFQRCVDGDTAVFLIDMGMRVYTSQVIRLARVNTPELNELDSTQKELAKKAKAALEGFLTSKLPVVLDVKKQDPYGRWVAEVFIGTENASDWLIAQGHGTPYP